MIFYGIGIGAEEAYKYIVNSNTQLDGVVDSNKEGIWHGYKISRLYEIKDKDTIVIITARSPWKIVEIRKTLLKHGFTNVYAFNWRKPYRENYDFLSDSCDNTNTWGDCVIPHIEMHIADSCNLNCRGCAHFSPIFDKQFPKYEECIRDITKAKSKFSHILRFYILGGEPLLNPELKRYLQGIRSELPNSDIWMVTNGLLIPKLDKDTMDAIRENNIVVSISEYYPTHTMIDKIKQKLEENNICYDLRPYDKKQIFNLPLSLSKNSMHKKKCISDGCINIYNGKISRCPTLMYINRLNECFNTSFPTDGIIDLSSELSGDELLAALAREIPLCSHCIENEIEWKSCGDSPTLGDFATND